VRLTGWIVCAACSIGTHGCVAQAVEAAADFGTVNGHVTLSDSNAPARFALVSLQPIDVKPEPAYVPGKTPALSVRVYQTDLDGGYSIPRVRPGAYYIVVNRLGYLSPIAQFSIAQLQHPIAAEALEIESTVPKITVMANAVTTKDIRLLRGAAISGTVRFDDGTALPRVRLELRHKDAAGQWVSVPDAWSATDSDGHYRVSGLFACDYLLSVSLDVDDRRQSSSLGGSIASGSTTLYNLRYYGLGDVLRARDATPVTLVDAQEVTGQDITIPVSKLHSLSGTVVDSRTGQGVNDGRVLLLNADDGSTLSSINIDAQSRSFRFPFVPEGSYILRITNAREVVFEPSSADSVLGAPPKQNVLRTYNAAEMPLVLHGETSGIALPVQQALKP
jgi:hypothetical protein